MSIFCKKRLFSKKHSSHVHILSKKPPSSHKHGASCHLHQFFYEKTPAVMQVFGQNASILPKLHYTMGYKSQKYTLFPIFHTKINAIMIFCKKRRFSKKHNALVPIFYQKNVHSL